MYDTKRITPYAPKTEQRTVEERLAQERKSLIAVLHEIEAARNAHKIVMAPLQKERIARLGRVERLLKHYRVQCAERGIALDDDGYPYQYEP